MTTHKHFINHINLLIMVLTFSCTDIPDDICNPSSSGECVGAYCIRPSSSSEADDSSSSSAENNDNSSGSGDIEQSSSSEADDSSSSSAENNDNSSGSGAPEQSSSSAEESSSSEEIPQDGINCLIGKISEAGYKSYTASGVASQCGFDLALICGGFFGFFGYDQITFGLCSRDEFCNMKDLSIGAVETACKETIPNFLNPSSGVSSSSEALGSSSSDETLSSSSSSEIPSSSSGISQDDINCLLGKIMLGSQSSILSGIALECGIDLALSCDEIFDISLPIFGLCSKDDVCDMKNLSIGAIQTSCNPSSSSSVPAPSSSSSEMPSSSSSSENIQINYCEGFNPNAEVEHYGKMKKQFCDERDGKRYAYVEIGEQTWMVENLNYAGEEGNVIGICYDNGPAYCARYGRLYDWATSMALPLGCNSVSCANDIETTHRGICPEGWHIPANKEWNELYHYADGTLTESTNLSLNYQSSTAGRYLKAASDWNDYNGQSGNGLDSHGFAALPGSCGYPGGFNTVGIIGFWRSSSEPNNAIFAYNRIMHHDNDIAYASDDVKSTLYSVRCIRD